MIEDFLPLHEKFHETADAIGGNPLAFQVIGLTLISNCNTVIDLVIILSCPVLQQCATMSVLLVALLICYL
jgi:hypothetical protein